MNESVALGIMVIIYIVSVITAWWLTVKVYQKELCEKPDEMDALLIFAPVINFAVIFAYGTELFFKKRNKTFVEWFFRQ